MARRWCVKSRRRRRTSPATGTTTGRCSPRPSTARAPKPSPPAHPMEIKRGIDKAVEGRRHALKKSAKAAKDRKRSLRSARSARTATRPSASSRRSDGKVGKEGVITVEEAKELRHDARRRRGYAVRPRYLSPYFSPTPTHGSVARGRVILLRKEGSRHEGSSPGARAMHRQQKPLLIIAETSRVRRSRPSSSTSSAARSKRSVKPGFGDDAEASALPANHRRSSSGSSSSCDGSRLDACALERAAELVDDEGRERLTLDASR